MRNYALKNYSIEINLSDLSSFDEPMANLLLKEPTLYLEVFEIAAKEALEINIAEIEELELDIQVILTGNMNPIPIRNVTSTTVSKLVRVQGIIVSSSRIRAKSTSIGIECKFCHDVRSLPLKSSFGSVELPKKCIGSEIRLSSNTGEGKCGNAPYVIFPDKCTYVDQQVLKLQEAPETIPTGEMPRHIQLVVDRSLVGKAVPGTRVVVMGISSLYSNSTVKSVQESSVRHPYLRVVGIEVSNDGVGRVSTTFTEAEVTEFRSISRKQNTYEWIVSKIAPAIYGNEDIKKAISCQLFGGCRKLLPDGMRLRGDINILLLGDPGTAKSQFLKFVERVAPIGVYTSGKGSSAAGLTASVIKDPTSKEFYLEGGAMVLGDGGIVCIDEFDKMRQQDRVAIHEAMEQQTISIAKAGITTILNARSAVIAAANPSFGVYDDSHSASENLNEFRSTILSRFDCIFLIKDKRDGERDSKISQHVIDIHMKNKGVLNNEKMNEDDIFKLKRYIAYCRENCFPRLTESASNLLSNHYVSMRMQYKQREKTGEGNAVPITVRQLEAIVRLSESLAKMTLSPFANEDHVLEAIRLFTVSSIEATNSGKVVLEQLPDNMRSEIESVEVLIKKKLPIESTTRVKNLIMSITKSFGVSELSVRKAIQYMVQKDELEYRYKRHGIYRKK